MREPEDSLPDSIGLLLPQRPGLSAAELTIIDASELASIDPESLRQIPVGGVVCIQAGNVAALRSAMDWARKHALDPKAYGVDPAYFFAVVPLDGAGAGTAQRFVLGLKNLASGWKPRLKRTIQQTLIRLGKPERLYEGFLVLARPAQGTLSKETWWIAPGEPGASVTVAMTSCRKPHGNDLALHLEPGAVAPKEVFKAVRDPRFGAKIENEAAGLTSAATDSALQGKIPRLIDSGHTGGRPYLIQSGLAGTSLATRVLGAASEAQAIATMQPAIRWLGQWQKVSEPRQPTAPWNSISRLDDDLLQAHEVYSAPEVRDRLGSALTRMRVLEPGFRLHGDFWQTNLLIDGSGQVDGLFDWEFHHAGSSVPSDCIWYLINAAYFLAQRERAGATIRDAFRERFPASPDGDGFIASEFRRYCDTVKFPVDRYADAVTVTLLQLSQRERRAYGDSSTMDEILKDLTLDFLRRTGPGPEAEV